ncbi:MAG: hypothetical protein CVU48_03790 [Candidatus Cloacimonetes bacterium HGW-Cloacimonetes-1]|jgi:hypothetical protein|nr:MAG: hypothetical protein CVU48_03790 [Candidatus Cloacimonetes bacterium HGW-Cloacimonetes-1]
MKKLFFLIMMIAFVVGTFANTFQVNLGIDLPGSHDRENASGKTSWDTLMGVTPSFEILMNSGVFMSGAGVEIQIPRRVDIDGSKSDFGFIPLYLAGRIQLPLGYQFVPEIAVNMGYNFMYANDDYKNNSDLTGGFYWALGGGVSHGKGVFQLLYKVNHATEEKTTGSTTTNTDITNSQFCFNMGYRF